MAAGAWTPTNATRTKMLDGTFVFGTDSFKVALLSSSSNIGAASTTFAGVTGELSTANGYTAGGVAVTMSLSGTTTVTVDSGDVFWDATGSGITARFACLYEVGGNVVLYCLLDSTPADVTVASGFRLTITIAGYFDLA